MYKHAGVYRNLHLQYVSSEARVWERYWKNHISSKFFGLMHDSCFQNNDMCEECRGYEKSALFILE